MAIPATDLRLGMPSDATADPGTTQRAAYDAISDGVRARHQRARSWSSADLTGVDRPDARRRADPAAPCRRPRAWLR